MVEKTLRIVERPLRCRIHYVVEKLLRGGHSIWVNNKSEALHLTPLSSLKWRRNGADSDLCNQLMSGPSAESCLIFFLFSIVIDNNGILYSIVICRKSEYCLLITWLLIKKSVYFVYTLFFTFSSHFRSMECLLFLERQVIEWKTRIARL